MMRKSSSTLFGRDLGTNVLIFTGSEVKDIIDFQGSLPENNFYSTMTVGKKTFLSIFGNPRQ